MSDFHAIEAVVNIYFKALHEGKIELLPQVFSPHAEIFGYYEGELVMLKLSEYLNILKKMSPPNTIGEDFDMKITHIDLVADIAHVKTQYLYQALNYVDYLSLLKINDEWKVVNKTFHHDWSVELTA